MALSRGCPSSDETQLVRVRLRPPTRAAAFDRVLAMRRHEADEFYAEVIPVDVSGDERLACRGLRRDDLGRAVLRAATVFAIGEASTEGAWGCR